MWLVLVMACGEAGDTGEGQTGRDVKLYTERIDCTEGAASNGTAWPPMELAMAQMLICEGGACQTTEYIVSWTDGYHLSPRENCGNGEVLLSGLY